MNQDRVLGQRYRLDELIDGGGMGEVWRGRDVRRERTVAIKVLHAGLSRDPAFRRRFETEARTVSGLRAPGIVELYDYGEDDSSDAGIVAYLVMEYLPGSSLHDVLRQRGVLEVEETVRLLAQTAEALEVAHRAGIVHRDIKPGNILIAPDGHPKIVDFGIARTHGHSSLTDTGMVMGSVCYVAPEQLYGEEPSAASDVYSLGIVGYEALAGRKPFDSDVPVTIIADQIHREPPPLPGDVPEDVAAVIMRALAKEPQRRWESAAAFASACRGLLGDEIPMTGTGDNATVLISPGVVPTMAVAKPGAPPLRAAVTDTPADERDAEVLSHRRSSTQPRVIAVAATLAVLLAAGGIAVALPWDDDPRPRPGSDAADSSEAYLDDTGQQEGAIGEASSSSPSSSSSSSSSSADAPSSSSSRPKPETSTSTQDKPDKAKVPYILGLSEADAFDALFDAGFENVSSYQIGEGVFECGVIEQNPGSGSSQEVEDPVSFGVEYNDECYDGPGKSS